jgi:hypothetical protein
LRRQQLKPRNRLVPVVVIVIVVAVVLLGSMKADVVGAEQTTDEDSTKTTLSTVGAELGEQRFSSKNGDTVERRPGLTSVKNWIGAGS